MESPSYSKQGGLFISPCNFSEPLFPLHKSPSEWRSCNDAYSYSWSKDFKKELTALSRRDSAKLINSMGFCPQNRCQLFNLSSAAADGMSPEGLCYTKIENGGLSYGACAFHKGVFNAGALIGYYYKTQLTPKPIYKKSRIVLGNKRGELGGADESLASFINANQIHSGLIATQCPLASRPSGFHNTVDDVKRMIIENNITLWIQLAPSGLENFVLNGTYIATTANCGIFPLEFFKDSSSVHSKGVTNFSVAAFTPEQSHVEITYTLTGYMRISEDGRTRTTFDDMSIHRTVPKSEQTNHLNQDEVADVSGLILSTLDSRQSSILDTVQAAEVGIVADKRTNSTAQPTSADEVAYEEIPLIWKKVVVRVKHVWYHKWKDFSVPPPEDEKFMQSLAQEAAALLAARESSVAVSCLSGRGRTGTFSAIVVGKLLSIKTLSELVDVIVSMRENRDGLVETPAQFRFAAHALDLPDPSQCNFPCYVTRLHESVLRSHIHAPYVIGMIVGSLACLTLEATSKDRTMLDAISRVLQALKGHQYEPLYDATASRKIPPPVLEVEVTAGIDNDKDL